MILLLIGPKTQYILTNKKGVNKIKQNTFNIMLMGKKGDPVRGLYIIKSL